MDSEQNKPETVSLAYDVYKCDEMQPETSPILLIHGLFWHKYMYKRLGESLRRATNRTVYTLDLRNHGDSPSCKECTTLLMTEDVKTFMRDQNLKKVIFVCHSFSSSIAYLIAIDQPESVEKIVMIDHAPFGEFSEKIYRENVVPQFNSQNRFINTFDPKMSLMAAKSKILSLASRATKGQVIFLKKVAYDLDKQNNQFKWKTDIKFLLDKYAEQSFIVKPKGSIDKHILIIRCKNSTRISESKFKDVLKYCSNAKMETFDNATHLLMFEEMEKFIEVVKKFIDS